MYVYYFIYQMVMSGGTLYLSANCSYVNSGTDVNEQQAITLSPPPTSVLLTAGAIRAAIATALNTAHGFSLTSANVLPVTEGLSSIL